MEFSECKKSSRSPSWGNSTSDAALPLRFRLMSGFHDAIHTSSDWVYDSRVPNLHAQSILKLNPRAKIDYKLLFNIFQVGGNGPCMKVACKQCACQGATVKLHIDTNIYLKCGLKFMVEVGRFLNSLKQEAQARLKHRKALYLPGSTNIQSRLPAQNTHFRGPKNQKQQKKAANCRP